MKKFKYFLALILITAIAIFGYRYILAQQPVLVTPQFQVTFLDVGQADSTVIQCDSSYMLIDAGTNSTVSGLVSNLKSMGIRKFDVIVGTHPHEDHIGGMDAVIDRFDIGNIYMPQVYTTTETFKDVVQAINRKGLTAANPVSGTSFILGSAVCTILAPNHSSYEELNDYSIVIRLHLGNTSFLFTGDAQSVSEKEMLAKSYTLKSDVLKVGHHGSSSSTTPEFLKAVLPKYAIIMVGGGNDYGHPHQETLDKLNAAGIKIYRTDLNGDIRFTSDGPNLAVTTAR